jgi:hypothetical protein
MAGEYSRELSTKVFKGQCRLIELGYRQGGAAGYGLRRMLINERGEEKGLLKRGEKKSLQTDRVVLVPGPEVERRVVQRIYQMFTSEGLKESQIAARLNAEGIMNTEMDRPWTAGMVHQVLTNEKYIGNNIYNRISFKLKKKRVRNTPDRWVRRDGAFPPIVEPAIFYTARGIIMERARRFGDEELVAKLKGLLDANGTLSAELIDSTEGMPSSSSYQSRFGSLLKAYQLVGFVPDRDYRYVGINRHLRTMRPPFLDDIIKKLGQLGARVTADPRTGQLLVNALKNMGETEAFCLVATDDETYTYNNKVNQVSPIQETFMIQKALERGVPEQRIANALNIDVGTLRRKRNLLEGICPDAVELLKDTRIAASALAHVKRVTPARQVEMVELMLAVRNYTASYSRCMYLATPADQRLVAEAPGKDEAALSPEEAVRLNREMTQLHRDIRAVEASHGETALNLVLAVGYLKTLVANSRVVKHLTQHHAVVMAEFQKIVSSPDLDGPAAQSAG